MLEIRSLKDTVNGEYTKPDIHVLAKYRDALKDSESALAYLRDERGLSDDTIEHFRLGYDSERDAIAIPIFKNGTLINIKYRFINPTGPKYIGEAGAENWLYNEAGITAGVKFGKVLIVEGEFDLMSVWQAGIKNVVSPASGKDSYGVWIELLDKVKQVYIAYDNDKPGRDAAKEMAERIGSDKSFEVKYPDGIKDANEFFKTHTPDDFKALTQKAKPYYSYQFKGMGDIIDVLRNKKDDTVKVTFIPKVEIEKDWVIVVSGRTNVGKTSYALNLADDLSKQNKPVLVMPFERGIESVGKRFLQVKFDKNKDGFMSLDDDGWDKVIADCVETPVYFAVPAKEDIVDTVRTARRLFNTKFVIVDHLDYLIRHVSGNRESEISNTLQSLKTLAEEIGVVFIIITHTRKLDDAGSLLKKTPGIEDLKGSSSLYQDPECVVMLSSNEPGEIHVEIVKNKGEMTSQDFAFNLSTGKMNLSAFDQF